jgi:N-acyl-phosphatidylethanolamine-hydrolysing phospholipase D
MSRRYSNPWPHEDHSVLSLLRWRLVRMPDDERFTTDDSPAPLVPFTPAAPPEQGWRITWLGHASFLIQGLGHSFLIDPVFADHCAPFPIKSLYRRVPLPCRIEDLPKINAILLTHSHYDHLDLASLRTIGTDIPVVISSGHSKWMRGKGFSNVRELAWNESLELFPGIKLSSTPAQHFSARTPFDRNVGHWCGWLLEGGGVKLWHAGDTGYCPAFQEIGEKHGPIDFAMIPIGAYSPRWFMRPIHIDPEEAVQVFLDARCKRAIAMHWGTFPLTDEPMSEPPLRLRRAVAEAGLAEDAFTTGAVGQSWTLH